MRILIVEEQVLCSEMLSEILSAQPGLHVVATARTAAAAEALLAREGVDVVLLDLLLPDRSGLELIGALAARGSRARLVVCSAMNHRAAIATAFSLGAHAFVPKTATLAELIDTLRRAARGECCLTPASAEALREHALGGRNGSPLQPGDLGVLRRLALHEPVREISAAVGLSASGVYKVRRRIARATSARSKRDFYEVAVRLGLVAGAPNAAGDSGLERAGAA